MACTIRTKLNIIPFMNFWQSYLATVKVFDPFSNVNVFLFLNCVTLMRPESTGSNTS